MRVGCWFTFSSNCPASACSHVNSCGRCRVRLSRFGLGKAVGIVEFECQVFDSEAAVEPLLFVVCADVDQGMTGLIFGIYVGRRGEDISLLNSAIILL